MNEPYLLAVATPPDDGIWHEKAPVDFKDPDRGIYLVPVTPRVLSQERAMYTEDEVKADPEFVKAAIVNTRKNRLRRNTDNDFISLRSDNTQIPCTSMFFMDNRETVFKALAVDPIDYFIVFITSDEVLMADRIKFRPSNIRRMVDSIVNRISSLYPDDTPILCKEVFEYGPDGHYKEV